MEQGKCSGVRILLGWVKTNEVMLINATSLVGTTAVTSILGFVYWWAAARSFSPAAVGIASASVSAMNLLGGLSILGLGTLLITELPRQPRQAGSLISTSLMVVGVAGGITGVVFAIVAPLTSPGFKLYGSNLMYAAIFASGVSLLAISTVLDQALVGLLRGGLLFWRNALFAVTKLVALMVVIMVVSGGGEITIYTTWVVSNALSMIALLPFLVCGNKHAKRDYRPRWGLLRTLGSAALQHHLLNLMLQAPTLALPVLVTVLLSATTNAWFYVAWMISGFVFLVPNVLTIVLHAMNSAQQSTLGQRARMTISLGFVASLLANSLLLFATKQVLGMFGSSYAEHAALILRILVLAAFPLIIKYHYIAICRIQDRIARAMLSMLPGGLLELGAAIAGAHVSGVAGLSAGWVAAIYIESLFMFHTVYKTLRSSGTRAPSTEMRPVEAEAFWLMNTAPLPIIVQSGMGIEASWIVNTSQLPARSFPATGNGYKKQVGRERIFTEGANERNNGRQRRLRPLRLQPLNPSRDDRSGAKQRLDSQFFVKIRDGGTLCTDETHTANATGNEPVMKKIDAGSTKLSS